MARRRYRSSSILPLNTGRGYQQQRRQFGRSENRGSGVNTSPKFLSGPDTDLAGVLSRQMSVLGQGPLTTLTPNIEAFAPEGGPAAIPQIPADSYSPADSYGGGTQLIDALAAEPGPPIEPMPAYSAPPEAAPSFADTGVPYGGTSGSPAADQALVQAEQTYGVPGYETPLAAATQESMLGSTPGASLYDIVPGYQAPYDPIAAYNQNKLYRLLLEGY